MAKSSYEKKLDKKTRAIVLWTAAAVLLILLFLFLILFRVRTVEVVGNYHYTDGQIEEMIMKGPFSKNTVLLSLTNKHRKIAGADFISSVSVDMTGMNAVRIQVSEKELIGYVSADKAYWYFDKDGTVLVRSDTPESKTADTGTSSAESASASRSTTSSAASSPDSISSGSTASADTAKPQEVTEDSAGTVILSPEVVADSTSSGTADSGSSGEGVTKPKEARQEYIPQVDGLSFDSVAVGSVLPVADRSIFAEIASLKSLINKNNIVPDAVTFAVDGTLSLTYGSASVLLGSDENLEEKLSELTGILPKMEGMSGTLHLENFDGTQDRVIFDKS